jgi:cytochrome c oxidase accessory protein FixG
MNVQSPRPLPGIVTQPGVDQFDVRPVNKRSTQALYKKREKIHPKRAKGFFRRLKWIVMAVTLTIYYLTPWLRWDRGPGAPDQAVLIDFPERRFYFFFIEIWPQEVYYLTGLLIMAGIGLFLMTSIAGRVWCGYACPQTVWTDLFLVVERAVEGDRNARIRLDQAPWNFGKLRKRLTKHAIWLLIAVATGGAWVFYFADAPSLAIQLLHLEAPQTAYATIGVLTFTTYLFGGLMREQVCTYMCPWPRIQGAMLDEESLVVTYHGWRGEPRGKHLKGEGASRLGDCVDCNACVVVCPMGIDIRDGQQLECITCALCIDACNGVMAKLGRAPNLIGYDTLANDRRRAAGLASHYRLLRPRTVLYAGLWVLMGLLMVYVLATRSDLDISVLHDRSPMFVTLSDGALRNGYTVHALNKQHALRRLTLSIEGLPGAALTVIGDQQQDSVLEVPADDLRSFRVYVREPAGTITKPSTPFSFVLTDAATGKSVRYETMFRGPG